MSFPGSSLHFQMMTFKLNLCYFLCCILCIHRDICEHVKLNATIQYNGFFSIQLCSNHNLASPLTSYHWVWRSIRCKVGVGTWVQICGGRERQIVDRQNRANNVDLWKMSSMYFKYLYFIYFCYIYGFFFKHYTFHTVHIYVVREGKEWNSVVMK